MTWIKTQIKIAEEIQKKQITDQSLQKNISLRQAKEKLKRIVKHPETKKIDKTSYKILNKKPTNIVGFLVSKM